MTLLKIFSGVVHDISSIIGPKMVVPANCYHRLTSTKLNRALIPIKEMKWIPWKPCKTTG